MIDVWFYIALPITALLFASIGHGGASGYLALMFLFGLTPDEMKPTALTLNLFVAGISFLHFALRGHLKIRLFLAFGITSIPFAYLGGTFDIDDGNYKLILGVFLLFAVAKMLGLLDGIFKKDDLVSQSKNPNLLLSLLLGGLIGFLSGMIGIGGGIILSPVILLLNWGNVKEAAAVSALFIWVNSAAGLIGQISGGRLLNDQWWLFVVLVTVGGFFGGLLGSKLLDNKKLQYLLGFVLLFASIKLIFAG